MDISVLFNQPLLGRTVGSASEGILNMFDNKPFLESLDEEVENAELICCFLEKIDEFGETTEEEKTIEEVLVSGIDNSTAESEEIQIVEISNDETTTTTTTSFTQLMEPAKEIVQELPGSIIMPAIPPPEVAHEEVFGDPNSKKKK
jgi:hypothetical protein